MIAIDVVVSAFNLYLAAEAAAEAHKIKLVEAVEERAADFLRTAQEQFAN